MDIQNAWNNLVSTIRALRLSGEEHDLVKARLADMANALRAATQQPTQPAVEAEPAAEPADDGKSRVRRLRRTADKLNGSEPAAEGASEA